MADASIHPHTGTSLLGPADPAPFTVHQAQGRSSYLLIADH
ncbi:MAG: N-formylglutamate amidohydrolase, partial [Stenotrophomonas maltophilia]